MNPKCGRQLLNSLVHSKDGDEKFRKLPLDRAYFKGSELELYDVIHKCFLRTGQLPHKTTLQDDYGLGLGKKVPEPPEYYFDLVKERHVHMALKQAFLEGADHLNKGSPYDALQRISEAAQGLVLSEHKNRILDYAQEGHGMISDEYLRQKRGLDVGLPMGWPTLDEMAGGMRGGDLFCFVGRPASGKALRDDELVVMSDGSRRPIKDMRVGDRIASVDGGESYVTGVYPQGVKRCARVTFGDGRNVVASMDHLWEVGYRQWHTLRVMDTQSLLELMTNSNNYNRRLYVKCCNGQFGSVCPTGPVSPYVLGVLLGDGCFRAGNTVRFTSMDSDLVERVRRELPDGYILGKRQSDGKAGSYSLRRPLGSNAPNIIVGQLREWGLHGHLSKDKFIPEEVFTWTRADRIHVLQGLIDTDGTVGDGTGSISFSTSSPRLIEGFKRLVRSVGGKATFLKVKNTPCLPSYRTTCIFKDRGEVVFVDRKRKLLKDYTRHNPDNLVIDSIELVEDASCTCISVSHPSKLFLAGDYTPTHNTYCGLYTALSAWRADKIPLFISMEMKPLLIAQRLAAMDAKCSITQLKKAELSTKKEEVVMAQLESNKSKTPFWIVDGSLALNVSELTMQVQQLKPDAVYIDGAYLMQSDNPRLSRWEKNTDVAEKIKSRIAEDMNIPAVISYQMNRQAQRKEGGGLDTIAYTDAIGQLSSVVLGMMEDESIETLKRRKISILKGRSGESGEFIINWNFDNFPFMDFSEVAPTEVSSLQFL